MVDARFELLDRALTEEEMLELLGDELHEFTEEYLAENKRRVPRPISPSKRSHLLDDGRHEVKANNCLKQAVNLSGPDRQSERDCHLDTWAPHQPLRAGREHSNNADTRIQPQWAASSPEQLTSHDELMAP